MKQVLVVDDEVVYSDFLKRMVDWQRYGLSVPHALESGQQALEYIGPHPVDLAIVDMFMPGISGLELIGELRKRKPELPILVLSGYDQYPLVSGAFRLSVCDYLLKTEITADLLINTLRSLLRRLVTQDLDNKKTLWLDDDLDSLFSRVYATHDQAALMLVRGDSSIQQLPDSVERIDIHPELTAFISERKEELLGIGTAVSSALLPAVLYGPEKGLLAALYSGAERLNAKVWLDRDRIRTGDFVSFLPLQPGIEERLAEIDACIQDASVYVEQSKTLPLPDPSETDNYNPYELGEFYSTLQSRVQVLAADPSLQPESRETLTAFLCEYEGACRVSCLNALFIKALDSIHASNKVNYSVLQKVNQYIAHGYAGQLSLGDLARRLGLSDAYLSRAISQSTGKTFSQLLLEYRMKIAHTQIEAGETRVYDLAASVGYSSYESFSRAFKRMYRKSPQSYIQHYTSNRSKQG